MAKYTKAQTKARADLRFAPEVDWLAIEVELSAMRDALGSLSLRPESFALIGHIIAALALVRTEFMPTGSDAP